MTVLRFVWARFAHPVLAVYTAAVTTYVAVALTLGWFR